MTIKEHKELYIKWTRFKNEKFSVSVHESTKSKSVEYIVASQDNGISYLKEDGKEQDTKPYSFSAFKDALEVVIENRY